MTSSIQAFSIREADAAVFRLKLIGSMEAVTVTGTSILPVGGKTRALLAILALADRKPVLRSHLAELLWSKRPEEMARASLRQEIHRLQEALRPLGVNVVEVQRSSLTLKPVLTSVDVERLKSGGLNAAGLFMDAGEKLLPDLDGIDPALDAWLNIQRFNLRKYFIAQYEAALLEARDQSGIETASTRLLNVDPLNELGWRVRIEAAIRCDDMAQARHLVIQFKRLLSESPLEVSIEQVTQDLLENVLRYDHQAARTSVEGEGVTLPLEHYVQNERVRTPDINSRRGSLFDGGESSFAERDPMLMSPFHLENTWPDATRRISVHIQKPKILDPMTWEGHPSSDDLHECLEVFFLRAKFFQVVPLCGDEDTEDAAYLDLCKKAGIDYVIRSVLRVGFQDRSPKIIIRLIDVRSGGIVAWGGYESIENLRSNNIYQILGDIFSDLHWSIVLSELMRISPRKDEDLSSIGRSVRAFGLALRFNVNLFPHIIELIGEPSEDAHAALATTIAALSRLNGDFSVPASDIIKWGVEGARQAMALQPERSAVALLWGILTMVGDDCLLSSLSYKTSLRSVVQTAGSSLSVRERYMYAALEALLDGDMALGADRARAMLDAMHGSPLRAFYEMLFSMTIVVGASVEKALEQANRMVSLYPRHPMSAVSLVIAAVRAGLGEKERARVVQHARGLLPDVAIEEIVKRCGYLPQQGLDVIRMSLMKADFH